MPHARKTGTAWDRRKEDYAYTRELDGPGWAWEFLRRNEAYRRDYRENRAGLPVAIRHVSGATLYRPRRRFLAAENWGLELFAEPGKPALKTDLFWLPDILTKHVRVCLSQDAPQPDHGLSLEDFACHRAVLCTSRTERVIVRHGPESVTLSAYGLSILHGNRRAIFEVDGYVQRANSFDALQSLARLAQHRRPYINSSDSLSSKWEGYLIALDGNLDGKSYRDIAEVIYGKDRVGAHWTDDTRWMKSKVRRAVERGLDLMNGGYRELL